MAEKTSIQWTDVTWNIARGCTKVDEDCKYCYMYRESMNNTRYNPMAVTRTKTVFNLPLKLKEPKKIFTSSLTDVYHEGCDSFRHEMFDIIRKCPHHTFQILTKRPERIVEQTPGDILDAGNVWFGTSVGSQSATRRMHELLSVDCAVRFISFEPLHERVHLYLNNYGLRQIDWAIIGGESGNETGIYKYRPCEISWIEDLVDQLRDVPIFIKQMGTYLAKQMNMSDRHGSNIDEFPEHLRIRQFPFTATDEDEDDFY